MKSTISFLRDFLRFVCLRLCPILLATAPLAQAGDIVVTTNADAGNGTLRQAIQFNESLGGGNRIVFANNVIGPIKLTNILGELVITKDVTIVGPGARTLAVDGVGTHTVLHIAAAANVTISGLTFTNGYSGIDNNGGGIVQDLGTLTLSNCVITSCRAYHFGGGFYLSATARVVSCSVVSNAAYGAMRSAAGGGVVDAASVEFINCTFVGNSAPTAAGMMVNGGHVALTNCTVAGNYSTDVEVGGIFNVSGTVNLRNTVVAGNGAPTPASPGADGAGSFISQGFNLIGNISGTTGFGALGDQIGTTNAPINPQLGPLGYNGGDTLTEVPLLFPRSPAVDQGNSSGVATDQRGRPRRHAIDYITSIPLGGDRSDIGACEVSPITLLVTNNFDSGPGSLRDTIPLTSPLDVDTVSFASNVVGTITLTSGELAISNSVNIVGPGPKMLAISGNTNSRVFHILGNDVVLSGLTITKGTNNPGVATALGGGVLNEAPARLWISNCWITGNFVRNQAAGIANLGILSMYSSTVSSNLALGFGQSGVRCGGIYNGNYAWIENCTISGNVASNSPSGFFAGGGGIQNATSDSYGLMVYYCTIASNTIANAGTLAGAGILNSAGVNNVIDTIVANNLGGSSPDLSGDFPYSSFDLIGNPGSSTGLTNGVNYNFVGSSASPLDPKLGPLRDNGGPAPTHALATNSPALDRAVAYYNGDTDQRGAPRSVVIPFIAHTNTTDGSDIGAFELGMPRLEISHAPLGGTIVSWPAYYGDFVLQSVTSLAASNSWNLVPGVTFGTSDRFRYTNTSSAPMTFYRLLGN